MATPITSIYQQFKGLDGQPLENGYIYIGIANQNPETAPLGIYWDYAMTQPAAQPLRTVNGYVYRSGTPANVFLASDYSQTVRSVNRSLVTTCQSAAAAGDWGAALIGPGGSALIGFIQRGTGAVERTVESKERDIVSVMDFLTTAEKTAVVAKTYGADVTVNMQKAYDAASSSTFYGCEVWHPSGGYLANNLTFNNHTTLRGPLDNRGEFWSYTNKGAVIRNSHASNNTLNGKGSGDYTLGSTVVGLSFEATGGTTGAHISLPDETNDLLIESNSFQGSANGIKTVGSVYDLWINRNFFQGQTAACISKQLDGGVQIHMTENYFRAGSAQAILAAPGGSGIDIGWFIRDNTFTGFTTAGVALVDVSATALRICEFTGNHFESNSGAGAWCAYFNGDTYMVWGNQFDNIVRGMEFNDVDNGTILNNRFSSVSGFGIQLNAACTNIIYTTQTGTTVTNNSADKTCGMICIVPTLTEKSGDAGGNYTTASASYADVDAVDLAYSVIIPTGWKLRVTATGVVQASAAAGVTLGIVDGVTIIEEKPIDIVASTVNANAAWALQKDIAGDAVSHTVKLQWKSSAPTATMLNTSAANAVRMHFHLTPVA